MSPFISTSIHLHLLSGRTLRFIQDDPKIMGGIFEDVDGQIFTRANLIIDSQLDSTSIPGRALIGITVLTDPIPEFLVQRERASKTVVTEISEEAFRLRRLQLIDRAQGVRGMVLSELEFCEGRRLFLEVSAVAGSGISERSVLSHLFTRSSLTCRRLDYGFSIWNTLHIVSWTHYPKLEAPTNAWQAEPMAGFKETGSEDMAPVVGDISIRQHS